MTILAQRWLEDHLSTPIDKVLTELLELPTKAEKRSVENTTERIVCAHNIDDVLEKLFDNKQLTQQMIFKTVHLPTSAVWVEWDTIIAKDQPVSVGVLFMRMDEQTPPDYIIVIEADNRENKRYRKIIAAGSLVEVLPTDKTQIEVVVQFIGLSVKSSTLNQIVSSILVSALGILFFMQQPRLIGVEQSDFGPKLQKKRQQAHKLPLLQYQRMTIKVWEQQKKRERLEATGQSISTGQTNSRCYHRVLGHFRMYENSKTPHTTWIDTHFRGDPAKGFIIKERKLV